MSDKLPVPSHVVDFINKTKAKKAVERMHLENMLLKHVIETIDPEHDYVFDDEEMTLRKVKKGEKLPTRTNQGNPEGDRQDRRDREDQESRPFRGQVALGV